MQLKYHPDKNQNQNVKEKFREMVTAYGFKRTKNLLSFIDPGVLKVMAIQTLTGKQTHIRTQIEAEITANKRFSIKKEMIKSEILGYLGSSKLRI